MEKSRIFTPQPRQAPRRYLQAERWKGEFKNITQQMINFIFVEL
ncbi:hypothetical protein [Flavobacterium pygoscelis]|nr:hypothetical protein [Flavobacterium pygoscelis]